MGVRCLGIGCLAVAANAQMWTGTGSMAVARRDHTATLLSSGKVLIVGWFTNLAELYDPTTGTFGSAGSTHVTHGQGSTATRLADGRVLILGGNGAQLFAEIYDPTAGSFSPTGTPNVVRSYHTATLLPSGRVLIAAGQNDIGPQSHAAAELYDPATGMFTLTGSLNDHRSGHAAARLPNGKVLIAGGTQTTTPGFGICLSSVEIYDPASGSFSRTGSMLAARCSLFWTQAPVLSSGKVLIAGGFSNSAELFDPTTGVFSATGHMTVPRSVPTATLLPDGKVLVAGGYTDIGPVTTNSAELYNPASGVFSSTANMAAPRQQHTATLLLNGKVLVTGGFNGTTELNSAELYSPACIDTLPPNLLVFLNPSVLNPPNRKMRDVTARIMMTDDCDPSPWVTLVSITADGPDRPAPRAGPLTDPDIQGAALGTDDREFELRAEMNANGRPRVYTVTYRAQDSSGKTATTTATVTVAHAGPQ